jgi:hypothetical protein
VRALSYSPDRVGEALWSRPRAYPGRPRSRAISSHRNPERTRQLIGDPRKGENAIVQRW